MSRGIIRFDGEEIAVSNTECMVLEAVFQAADNAQFWNGMREVTNVKLLLPNASDYLFFCKPKNGVSCDPIVNYDQGRLFCSESCIVYAYRRILPSDKANGTGLNIYNESGNLFYSSTLFPLQITELVDIRSFNNYVRSGKSYYNTVYPFSGKGLILSSLVAIQTERTEWYLYNPIMNYKNKTLEIIWYWSSFAGYNPYRDEMESRLSDYIFIAHDPFA
ncbi:hypothetical protein ID855_20040 [Xenorhabdus sp. ZM]|uniref:hypothetical protein n=1 Tax=Xenorhabdus szentirmaii TaxID=290112 RepID=UPI0019966CB0|nr:hypothetical protein [Xenorhabdus sp. ZM]MBD2806923.1 hypothetical protein [Xenorhabdus sp. ZM]